MLPREIAEELKRDGRVAPCHYDSATVLFTDFEGFTRISKLLTPAELIDLSDQSFQAFDDITHTHGLEKIKTIGDAYLAVGGIPRRNNTHAVDSALTALRMPRGRIPAKGKGELDMYLLKSIRAELSEDGVTPNARFHALYQAL